MAFQINQDPKQLADILETTMTNAGYFDDIDEVVVDMINDIDVSYEDLMIWAEHVDNCLKFINEHLNKDYDLSVYDEVQKRLKDKQ